MTKRYLDFKVVKEDWSVYLLKDGTKIKIRTVLESIRSGDKRQVEDYQQIVYLCDESVCSGQPRKRGEIKRCKYDTLYYAPSEYLVEDGTRIFLPHNILNIARTKRYQPNGDRVYEILWSSPITSAISKEMSKQSPFVKYVPSERKHSTIWDVRKKDAD